MVKRGATIPRYDWDDKRDICYKLYVEEKKSIAQIVQHFVDLFGIDASELPSKKVFHRQFTEKWGFPKRRAPLDENVEQQIATTMRNMWAQNIQLKDIHQTLLDQGHELNQYDFNKLRKKYNLNRRGDTGYTPLNANGKRPREEDDVANTQLTPEEQAMHAELATALPQLYPSGSPATPAPRPAPRMPTPPPMLYSTTMIHTNTNKDRIEYERLRHRALNPDEPIPPKVLGSKRRKRVHGFGDGEDPDAEPSYGSETSLDECKAFLGIVDNNMYLDIRAEYDNICREMGIERKKTALADGRWQQSKDRLVRNNQHLAATMNPLQEKLKQKELALDLICADVTKRLRDSRKTITIAQANNLLGLNPADSKELRRAFYEILEKDGYTNREACGERHWHSLQYKWYETSEVLTSAIRDGDESKVKAVKVLCRDASKRFNDDKARKDPSRKQYTREHYGPGPGAATHRGKAGKKPPANPIPSQASPQQARQAAPAANPTPTRVPRQPQALAQLPEFDANAFAQSLDPALSGPLTATDIGPSIPIEVPSGPVSAYFRLDGSSTIVGSHPRMWLGRLEYPTIMGLKTAAVARAGPARIRCIDGLILNPDKTEDRYRIDNDDELTVYLHEAGAKATFLVALDGGYA